MFLARTNLSRIVRMGGVCVMLLGGAALSACGDSGDDEPAVEAAADPEAEAHPTPDPNATPTPDPGPATTTLRVELNEWSVHAGKNTVPAGVIQFIADNTGTETHELVVVKNGEELVEIEGLKAGYVQAMRFRLEPGEYELACLLVETEPSGEKEDHYQRGMHVKFVVE